MEKAFKIVIERLRAKKLDKNILCSAYWAKLLKIEQNYNEGILIADDQAWRFFADNAQWVFVNGVITKEELLEWFTRDQLIKYNFLIGEEVELNDFRGVLFDCTGKVTGHSHITAFGPGTDLRAFDTSSINVFGGKVYAKDCFVFAFNDAVIGIDGYGKVEAFDEVKVTASGYSYVILGDNATCKAGALAHVIQS